MNNKLIRTDTVWYKIKFFFRRIFHNNKNNKEFIAEEGIKIQKNDLRTTLKKETEENAQKEKLAEKLLCYEIGCSELAESQVDSMTEYFSEDIRRLDNELSRIKKHILEMKQQLK